MVKINGVNQFHWRHGPAHPSIPHVIDRPESMSAFPHDDLIHMQVGSGVIMGLCNLTGYFKISSKHGHIAVVPTWCGRHGPINTCRMHDYSRLVDQAGLKFGFRSDDRIHDIGPVFIQRDS